MHLQRKDQTKRAPNWHYLPTKGLSLCSSFKDFPFFNSDTSRWKSSIMLVISLQVIDTVKDFTKPLDVTLTMIGFGISFPVMDQSVGYHSVSKVACSKALSYSFRTVRRKLIGMQVIRTVPVNVDGITISVITDWLQSFGRQCRKFYKSAV